MLLNCACELLPREPKGAEGSRTPFTGCPARNTFSWFCPKASFFLSRAVSRKTASWQQRAQRLGETGGSHSVVGLGHVHHEVGGRAEAIPAGEEKLPSGGQVVGLHDVPEVHCQGQGVAVHSIWHLTAETGQDRRKTRPPEPASQHPQLAETGRYDSASDTGRQAGASQHLASDGRGTSGKHRKTSGRHDLGDTQQASPQSQRRSIWHPDTGRQAGDTTPEPASQHLASDRRDWETSGRHDPGASTTKSGE